MNIKAFLNFHTSYGKNNKSYDALADKYTERDVALVRIGGMEFTNALYDFLKKRKELVIFKKGMSSEEMKKVYFNLFEPYFKLRMEGHAKTPANELTEKVIKMSEYYDDTDCMPTLQKILYSIRSEREENKEETKQKTPELLKIWKRTPPPGKHTLQKLLGFYS